MRYKIISFLLCMAANHVNAMQEIVTTKEPLPLTDSDKELEQRCVNEILAIPSKEWDTFRKNYLSSNTPLQKTACALVTIDDAFALRLPSLPAAPLLKEQQSVTIYGYIPSKISRRNRSTPGIVSLKPTGGIYGKKRQESPLPRTLSSVAKKKKPKKSKNDRKKTRRIQPISKESAITSESIPTTATLESIALNKLESRIEKLRIETEEPADQSQARELQILKDRVRSFRATRAFRRGVAINGAHVIEVIKKAFSNDDCDTCDAIYQYLEKLEDKDGILCRFHTNASGAITIRALDGEKAGKEKTFKH